MIGRLGGYIVRAYPPAFYVPFMLSWAVGLTALFVSVDSRVTAWRPGAELLVTSVTLVVDMLLLRALDDLRDRDYDLEHNPGRALPSGAVRVTDLLALVGAGAVALLALNAWRGGALLVLVAHLGYAAVVILIDQLFGWPKGERLLLSLAVNLPIQPLLSLYVYAGFLREHDLTPSREGIAAVAAVTLSGLCLEFGRKVTRHPGKGERTYVTALGTPGTTVVAVSLAAAAALAVLAILRPWNPDSAVHGWGWIVVVPAVLPATAAYLFSRGRPRWPALPTLAYLPAAYCSFIAVGWLTKGAVL
ncbi:hypothetical protein [Streptosporangium roseum]|uniref:hypothetical protein n=1 Tax=Streptosporangium roseum TaxID=2001 RepID=UPI0004CD7353|nr:hypothetical protein [Streptosporangium roseum]